MKKFLVIFCVILFSVCLYIVMSAPSCEKPTCESQGGICVEPKTGLDCPIDYQKIHSDVKNSILCPVPEGSPEMVCCVPREEEVPVETAAE